MFQPSLLGHPQGVYNSICVTKSTLLCSQALSTGPLSEPSEFSSHPQHISAKHILILFLHGYSGHSIALDVKTCVSGGGSDQGDIMFGLCFYVMNIQVYWEVAAYCGVSSSLCFKAL
jgi:hypothetical protein